jgi:hypothetical protein
MRIASAQRERPGTQAMDHCTCRVVLDRTLDGRQCVAVSAEKTRKRALEVLERNGVAGRRDQSSGVAQHGHGGGSDPKFA